MWPRAHSSTTAACSASGRRCRAPCWRTSTSCSETHDASPADLDALVVGTGPGSFTSTRIGLAVAQGLGLALELPVAGISTLEALASAQEGVYPVVDARRREVFVLGPRVLAPADLELEPGTTVVGSGAVRYRATLEDKGAHVPADDDEIHLPHARLHAALASEFLPAEEVAPLYVRSPDAKVRSPA